MKKGFCVGMMACVFLWAVGASAENMTTPHFFHYQAVLTDDGGNLLSNGPVQTTFRIFGSDDRVLYQEQQTLDIVDGATSALIGNGLDPESGAPTGGLSLDLLNPDQGRFLEVEVEGYPPMEKMEMVSVPYALFSERALGVQAGAIDETALAEKSVTLRHFADGTLEEIAAAMLDQGLLGNGVNPTDLDAIYQVPAGASHVGVETGLVYSGKNDLQGVLRDMDRAIDQRQTNLDAEMTARTSADNSFRATLSDINNISGTLNEPKITSAIARDSEVASAVAAEAFLRVTEDAKKLNLTGGTMTGSITMASGTTVDGYDVGVTLATINTTLTNINNISGTLNEPKIASTIARDSEVTSAVGAETTARQAEIARLDGIIDGVNGDISVQSQQPRIAAWWYLENPPGGTAYDNVTFTGQNISSITHTNYSPYYVYVEFDEALSSSDYVVVRDGKFITDVINKTVNGFAASQPQIGVETVDSAYFFSVVCCSSVIGRQVVR